jgi:hypothetical protein
MSIFSPLRHHARRVALAGAALATVAGVAGVAGVATTAQAAGAGPHPAVISCWKEYGFTRIGNTVIASAFKDCVNLDVPQPLYVSIKKFYYDDFGNSGWTTAASGSGNVMAKCVAGWPTMYRHSITGEQIYC